MITVGNTVTGIESTKLAKLRSNSRVSSSSSLAASFHFFEMEMILKVDDEDTVPVNGSVLALCCFIDIRRIVGSEVGQWGNVAVVLVTAVIAPSIRLFGNTAFSFGPRRFVLIFVANCFRPALILRGAGESDWSVGTIELVLVVVNGLAPSLPLLLLLLLLLSLVMLVVGRLSVVVTKFLLPRRLELALEGFEEEGQTNHFGP